MIARSSHSARSVAAFAANGARLRDYSTEAAERCVGLKLAIAQRHRRTGRITSIQFRPLPTNSAAVDGKSAIRKHAHVGQRYSYPQGLDDTGLRAWAFVPFLVPRDGKESEDIERALQEIFRAVPLSCLKSAPVTDLLSVRSVTGGVSGSAAASALPRREKNRENRSTKVT